MSRRGENIYKRKDGRYEGRFLRGHRTDGKPIFGYIYGYTYAQVKSSLTLAKAALSQSRQLRVIGRGSFSEYMHWWLTDYIGEQVKPSTYAQYYERINKHIVPALGDNAVCKITSEKTQCFIDSLSDKGLAPSTIRNIAWLLCSAMKTALELQLTSINPCENLNIPQSPIKERRALDRIEQLRLELAANGEEKSVCISVYLALYAGLRIGEICALRWRDIDLSSGIINVRGTLQRVPNIGGTGAKTILIEGEPKSKRSRRKIPTPEGIANKLRLYGKDIPGDFFVLTDSQTPVEPRTVRARFHKLAGKAGLSLPFHSLRHTYATRCLEHNFDIQSLAELLGHSSANVTMGVYAHSVFEHKRLLTDRISILSEIIEPSSKPSTILET